MIKANKVPAKPVRLMADAPIWPRVIYNMANLRFIGEDNPSIHRAFEADPDLWGFSVRFRLSAKGDCIPTHKMQWSALNKDRLTMRSPTSSKGHQTRAFLECVENCDSHAFAAKSLRAAPLGPVEQTESQMINTSTIVATYTRVGFLIHSLHYKNKYQLSEVFTHGESQYSADRHAQAIANREPHFGSSCLTMMLGEEPQSNHAKLAYQARVKSIMTQHLKYLSVIANTKKKFVLHPDWTLPPEEY